MLRPAVAFCVVVLSVAGCAAPTPTGSSSSPLQDATVHDVQVDADGQHTFVPAAVAAHVGDRIRFHIVHGPHTVDFAEAGANATGVDKSHSGRLEAGATYMVVVTAAGKLDYFCVYHSVRLIDGSRDGMTGVVQAS